MNRKTILMSPADSNIYNFFERQFNVISSDCIEEFIAFEKYHADMQAVNINGKIFVNSCCEGLVNKLETLAINYVKCENIGYRYPDNVALNAALVGNKLLCNKKALHPLIAKHCYDENIEIIHVNQGYTKCSTLVLDDNSIITDDESVAKASLISNISVLKIDKGDIILDDKNVGFIGGASAKIGDTVYFLGDIDSHKNATEIIRFIANLNLHIECVTSSKLLDIGGIVIL